MTEATEVLSAEPESMPSALVLISNGTEEMELSVDHIRSTLFADLNLVYQHYRVRYPDTRGGGVHVRSHRPV